MSKLNYNEVRDKALAEWALTLSTAGQSITTLENCAALIRLADEVLHEQTPLSITGLCQTTVNLRNRLHRRRKQK